MKNPSNSYSRIGLLFCTLATTTLLSSCGSVDSADLRSSGIYAAIDITSEGNNQTNVSVRLRTGSGVGESSVSLSEGDSLTTTAKGITKSFSHSNSTYTAIFSFNDSAPEFIVTLDRSEGDDMPNSKVTLPETFSILTPTSASIYSPGQSISTTWSPAVGTETIKIRYSGWCISSIDGKEVFFDQQSYIDDIGSHTILVNDLLTQAAPISDIDTNENCPITLELERMNTGTIDPNYGKGGRITAKQTRKVFFNINP